MNDKSNFPWQSMVVSHVADINPREKLPSREEGERRVPLFEMADIDEFMGILREPKMVPLSTCKQGKTKFRNGDVLFAKITPCVQNEKSALVSDVEGGLGFGSSEFYVLRAKSQVLPQYLFFFVRQKEVVLSAVDNFLGTSGRKRVPSTFWNRLTIPVPPLPVQERIVRILQKADKIRRKRQEALELSNAISRTLLSKAFSGELTTQWSATHEKHFQIEGQRKRKTVMMQTWPQKRLCEIAEVVKGKKPSKFTVAKESTAIPYLEATFLRKKSKPKYISQNNTNNLVLLDTTDTLILWDGANAGDILRGETGIVASTMARVRAQTTEILPEFLYFRILTFSSRLRKTSMGSTVPHVRKFVVNNLEIPLPPLPVQEQIARILQKADKIYQTRKKSLELAGATLQALLSRAFSGELTAAWETANADWIKKQTELQKHLPRLLLLAFIQKHTERAGNTPHVLVTALMKYAFLFQMEGSSRRRFYHFIPHHYGPFTKELYDDLERLKADGLVTVDKDADETRTRITLTNPVKAKTALAELPKSFKEAVDVILADYGGLDHNALLKSVYEKYPSYTGKSRIRKRRTATHQG